MPALAVASMFVLVTVALWSGGTSRVSILAASVGLGVGAFLADSNTDLLFGVTSGQVLVVRALATGLCLTAAVVSLSTHRAPSNAHAIRPLVIAALYCAVLLLLSIPVGEGSLLRSVQVASPVLGCFALIRLGKPRLPLQVLLLVAAGQCAYALTIGRKYVSIFSGGRLGGIIHPNTLGYLGAVLAVYGVTQLLGTPNGRSRAAAGSLVLGSMSILASGSRTALASALVGSAVAAIGQRHFRRNPPPELAVEPDRRKSDNKLRSVLVVGLSTGLVGWLVLLAQREKGFHRASTDSTLTGRSELWGALLQRVAERPFTGYGAGALREDSSLISQVVAEAGWSGGGAHNALLDATISGGVLAGLCWLLIVVALGRRAIQSRGQGALAPLFALAFVHSFTEAGAAGFSSAWYVLVALAALATESRAVRDLPREAVRLTKGSVVADRNNPLSMID